MQWPEIYFRTKVVWTIAGILCTIYGVRQFRKIKYPDGQKMPYFVAIPSVVFMWLLITVLMYVGIAVQL